jgi:prophage regulatory protein
MDGEGLTRNSPIEELIHGKTRKPRRLLRKHEVAWRIGYSVAWIDKAPLRDPTFPQRIVAGPRSIAFYEDEIEEWMANRQRGGFCKGPPKPKVEVKVKEPRARL